MKICPNCRNKARDEALFCPVCGNLLDVFSQPDNSYDHPEPSPAPIIIQEIPVYDRFDHTADFQKQDIQDNRLICLSVYVMGILGIIIALLMNRQSAYTDFHLRQGLRFAVAETLVSIVSVVLGWTFLVPIAGAVALTVLFVVKSICFMDVCKGRARDAYILRNIGFLN